MEENERITSLGRHLTHKDYNCLINLITDDVRKAHVSPSGLHTLYLLATNSEKYDSNNIPNNVVTLNSEIILVTEKMQKQLVKIVLPQDINEKNDISVYSPIGIAILGKKEKDFVFVKHNKTFQKLQIDKLVFQPEKEKLNHF